MTGFVAVGLETFPLLGATYKNILAHFSVTSCTKE